MQHPTDRRGLTPLSLLQLIALAAALPMGCTYLAVLVTALAMQALGGGGIDGMIQRLGRPEGHDGANDLAVEAAGAIFEISLLTCTVVLSTWRRLLPVGASWLPWRKDRSFLPFLGLMLTWQVFAEFVAEPSLPAMQHLPVGTPALLLSLFSTVALAPIAEELFFRGFIYANVRARAGLTTAVTITAGLFAFMYVGDSLALPASMLPLALIAALARERYGSVRPSIYLHAVWNLVAWGDAYFRLSPN